MSPSHAADAGRPEESWGAFPNTYVATEVTNGTRTLFVVRGTVIVERR
jgi:hypothetical protein